MFHDYAEKVLSEIREVLSVVEQHEVEILIDEIKHAKTIVVYGAGRVGLAIRGFGMRLGHLGFHAYVLGDATVPQIGYGDIVLLASGSGETQTVYDIAVLAKRNGARLCLITGRIDSRIGALADTIVQLKAPSKVNRVKEDASIQPMTTLNEQCLNIFFDVMVLMIMKTTSQDSDDLWARHSNLE
jgi:6-phospho-3-hexuloisomerase